MKGVMLWATEALYLHFWEHHESCIHWKKTTDCDYDALVPLATFIMEQFVVASFLVQSKTICAYLFQVIIFLHLRNISNPFFMWIINKWNRGRSPLIVKKRGDWEGCVALSTLKPFFLIAFCLVDTPKIGYHFLWVPQPKGNAIKRWTGYAS